MIDRRIALTGFAGAVVTWPLAARTQQPLPVIGFLGFPTPHLWAARMRAFHQGLSETGFVEGHNVAFEFRWAEGQNDRLPALAADLVSRQVTVIAAPGSTPAALAAKEATKTIPIVFSTGGDPVALGLVASLSRPGSNLTGVTSLTLETEQKQLQMLHELVPRATLIALLVNPTNPSMAASAERRLNTAARTFGLEIVVLHASTEADFNQVFASLAQRRVGALLIGADAFFSSQHEHLAALSLRHAIPTIFRFREFVIAGGLMSYGSSFTNSFRLVGNYIGWILKGGKPIDLPVQRATKLELVINLKTAKALGLTIAPLMLAQADEVIE